MFRSSITILAISAYWSVEAALANLLSAKSSMSGWSATTASIGNSTSRHSMYSTLVIEDPPLAKAREPVTPLSWPTKSDGVRVLFTRAAHAGGSISSKALSTHSTSTPSGVGLPVTRCMNATLDSPAFCTRAVTSAICRSKAISSMPSSMVSSSSSASARSCGLQSNPSKAGLSWAISTNSLFSFCMSARSLGIGRVFGISGML